MKNVCELKLKYLCVVIKIDGATTDVTIVCYFLIHDSQVHLASFHICIVYLFCMFTTFVNAVVNHILTKYMA